MKRQLPSQLLQEQFFSLATGRAPLCSANLLERRFGDGQRRAEVIPRFLSERSGLSLLFAVLVDASAGWRGVTVAPANH